MLGVEIGATRLRAVAHCKSGAPQVFEVPYTADRLDDAVAALAALAGDVAGIGLAIGLVHLHVTQVTLPPVPHGARRQMLVVEPERWFAAPGGAATAIALDVAGSIALAADGAFVDAWVQAFAVYAPVQRVEAAPMAMVRALRSSGITSTIVTLEAGPGELGRMEVVNGALQSVRRMRTTDGDLAPVVPRSPAIVESAFLTALGAALAFDGITDAMLLTPALARQFLARRRRQVVSWGAAAVMAVCTATWSIGVARDRLLHALEREVAAARRTAGEGTASITRVMTIDRELAAIVRTTAARSDVLAALAAVGARLPIEAVAQRVKIVGAEWQVEGNAATASAVLAALAAEPRFERVRFLAPSNRFRDGTADRETFAIAFAVR